MTRKASHVIGKRVPASWTHIRCEEDLPFARSIEGRDGRTLARDPVGFGHNVLLRCPEGLLPEAGRLRLMKAFALALDHAWRHPDENGRIHIHVREGEKPSVRTAGQWARILITPDWIRASNTSLPHLRSACMKLVQDAAEDPSVQDAPASSPSSGPEPEVLLFKNIFTKDVDSGDALQVNPGVHYLISALIREGLRPVLADGKIPLQDVCMRPPDVSESLPPDACITEPDALVETLRAHPDLNLVCLTVLERSFAQVRDLIRFIRPHTSAFIAVGGVFPTVTPEHCFAHLHGAHFLVRGDGEQVLPAIARMVAGRTIHDGIDERAIQSMETLHGFMARCGDLTVASDIRSVNRIMDLDRAPLDFSFMQRENVEHGLSLSTSRGCVYSCKFCSVMDKKLWRGRSADAVIEDLRAYHNRLVEIYGSDDAIPASARSLQIWDDDFFLDPERAVRVLEHMARHGFTTTFVQGTVSSFFIKQGRRITHDLNQDLVDAIPASIFTRVGGLKIGTESFSDRELRRLGKPYDFDRIHKLVSALARRGLMQDHYMILCNRSTSLDDLLGGLERITQLRWLAGPSFSVLEPSWLIDLFPTALYRHAQLRGEEDGLPSVGSLYQDGYPEVFYPFIVSQRPRRREVFEIVRRFPAGMHFGAAGRPDWIMEGVYGDEDPEYLRIFRYARKALLERLSHLGEHPDQDTDGETFRIQEALATHLGGDRWVPEGVLRQVAPALQLATPAIEDATRLADYLGSIVDWPSTRVQPVPEGAVLTITRDGIDAEFLVQRRSPDAACAFSTKNLAFVVRSEPSDEDERRKVSQLIRDLQEHVNSHDTRALD